MATIVYDLFVGDYGIPLEITVKNKDTGLARDLSDATSKTITFRRPDGSEFTANVVFVTPPGADGKVKYTFGAGDLTLEGTYIYQVLILTASSGRHTEHGSLNVGPALEL